MTKSRGIGRGGKRAGAGRPKSVNGRTTTVVSFTAPHSLAEWLRSRGVTATIVAALINFREKEIT